MFGILHSTQRWGLETVSLTASSCTAGLLLWANTCQEQLKGEKCVWLRVWDVTVLCGAQDTVAGVAPSTEARAHSCGCPYLI